MGAKDVDAAPAAMDPPSRDAAVTHRDGTCGPAAARSNSSGGAEQQAALAAELEHQPSVWRARRVQWKAAFCKVVCSPSGWQQRLLCVAWWAFVVAVLIVIFVILLPKALARPIQQLVALLTRKLKPKQLIAIIIGAVAFLPCTLILPMIPFIWVAGAAFDFGRAYAMVMAGSIIGMSIQYWAARYLFKEKAEKYLLERRKDGMTVALRAVEMAGPWKVVALVRLGPSPYAAMNYIFGVCPTIRYHQYIIASTLCIAHHRALSVFFGRSMPTLADLFTGKPVTDVGAAVYRIIVLVLGIILCVTIVIWAKRALKKLQEQELERERREAEAAAALEEEGRAACADGGDAASAAAAAAGGQRGSKVPLPVAVGDKLGAGGGEGQQGGSASPGADGSSSDGDLQVVIATVGSSLSLDSAGSGLIPAGQAPPAAAADSGSSASLGGGRPSSVSSLRGLLSGKFQRSA